MLETSMGDVYSWCLRREDISRREARRGRCRRSESIISILSISTV